MTNLTVSIDDELYNKLQNIPREKLNELICQTLLTIINSDKEDIVFADEELLAQDWLSEEDNEAWKDL